VTLRRVPLTGTNKARRSSPGSKGGNQKKRKAQNATRAGRTKNCRKPKNSDSHEMGEESNGAKAQVKNFLMLTRNQQTCLKMNPKKEHLGRHQTRRVYKDKKRKHLMTAHDFEQRVLFYRKTEDDPETTQDYKNKIPSSATVLNTHNRPKGSSKHEVSKRQLTGGGGGTNPCNKNTFPERTRAAINGPWGSGRGKVKTSTKNLGGAGALGLGLNTRANWGIRAARAGGRPPEVGIRRM